MPRVVLIVLAVLLLGVIVWRLTSRGGKGDGS